MLVPRVIPDEGLDPVREACEVDLWTDEVPPPRDELLRRAAGKDGLLSRSIELDADALVLRATVLTSRWIAELQADGIPILGTSPDAIDLAEDRERFSQLLWDLGVPQPASGTAISREEAREVVLGKAIESRRPRPHGRDAIPLAEGCERGASRVCARAP